MDYHFIINPKSGNDRGEKNWAILQQYLETNNIKYQFDVVRHQGQARFYANRLTQKKVSIPLTIVVVGGDGTLDDVITGLMSQQSDKKIPLGLIPSGSQNNLARAYSIALDPIKAFSQIQDARQPRTVNLIEYNESIKKERGFFFSSFGIGCNASIVSHFNNQFQRHRRAFWIGHLRFLRNAIAALYNQQSFSIMVDEDNRRQVFPNAVSVIISNQPYLLGNIKTNPSASLSSPKFDCWIIERHNWLIMLWQLIQFSRGKASKSRWIKKFHCNTIRFTTSSLEFVEKDGQDLGNRYVDMSLNSVKYPFMQKKV